MNNILTKVLKPFLKQEVLCIFLLLLLSSSASAKILLLPETGLGAKELALIVNDSDTHSRIIAAYYQKMRGIPDENIIHVRFPPEQVSLKKKSFEHIYTVVNANTPERVQAYLLTWTKPYKVGCMSITTAFATGYDENYCPKKIPVKPCSIAKKSPYYASFSSTPAEDFKLRPTMLLASTSLDEARRLIDRGVKADSSFPKGKAYLLSTTDKNRNVRAAAFPKLEKALKTLFPIEVLEQDYIQDKKDVLFYFTGTPHVPYLETLKFLPGAVADHLTSNGGSMNKKGSPGQMSSLRWLDAGATGSYGTVFEPCNFLSKFPDPGIMMYFYLRGESLIEAYWKSVAMPSEGLFIGEPLAKPFALNIIEFEGTSVKLSTHRLLPGTYQLEVADDSTGPYKPTGRTITIHNGIGSQRLESLDGLYYRLNRNR